MDYSISLLDGGVSVCKEEKENWYRMLQSINEIFFFIF